MSLLFNGFFLLFGVFEMVDEKGVVQATTLAMIQSACLYYGILFLIGLMTTITEWKNIHSPGWKKIAYSFTFPLFMFTYIPIALVALFKNVEWKPIAHTVSKSIDEVR